MLGHRADQGLPPNQSSSGLVIAFARAFIRFTGTWRTLLAGGVMLCSAVLEALGLILLVPMLSITIGAAAPQGRLAASFRGLFDTLNIERPEYRLMLLFGCFALVMVLRTIAVAFREVLLIHQQTAFAEAQVQQIVRRLAETPWAAIVRLKQSRVTHTLGSDIMHVKQAVRLLQLTVVYTILLIGQCAAAVILSPWLALICGALLSVGALFVFVTLRQAGVLGERTVTANMRIADSLVQYLGGLKLAVSQDLQRSYVTEMEAAVHVISKDQIAFVRAQSKGQCLFGILAALVGVLISAIGLALHIAPGTLVGFLIILVRMSGPAILLRQNAQQLGQALPSYAALRSLESDLVAAIGVPVDASRIPSELPFGRIEFRQVTYRHRDDAERKGRGLSSMSITIEPGEFLGIAGPSGAGKTTFVDLLVGLYEPDQGEIAVGGQTLSAETLGAWRRHISYVAQDAYLFHDSVRRNLLWANPDASEDALWAALRIVGADALVRAMPAGLDTIVGERGSLVSGGERQRIALARALVRAPRLLILDEATNAIGIAGERELILGILGLDHRPTILMIAHRPESLSLCDRVVTLEAG
jgi:ATP-binding cassette subfamily C protein